MSRHLAVLPSAVADMREAAARYESERRGLGRFFLQKLRALFQRVKNKPLQFPEIAHGIRRALVPKFPYGVFFRILEKKSIVIAVLHLHRHPATWRSRKGWRIIRCALHDAGLSKL